MILTAVLVDDENVSTMETSAKDISQRYFEDVKMQVITLKYLLLRFTNNKLRKFISTHELKSNLASRGFGQIDTLRFRTKITGKLRDADVIISSNSKGYKIPATKSL